MGWIILRYRFFHWWRWSWWNIAPLKQEQREQPSLMTFFFIRHGITSVIFWQIHCKKKRVAYKTPKVLEFNIIPFERLSEREKLFFRFFQKSYRITQVLDDNIGFRKKTVRVLRKYACAWGVFRLSILRRSLSARYTVGVSFPITYGYFPQWVFVFCDKGIFSAPQSFDDRRLILLFHPISSKVTKEQDLSYFVAKQLQIESAPHWQISYCHEA